MVDEKGNNNNGEKGSAASLGASIDGTFDKISEFIKDSSWALGLLGQAIYEIEKEELKTNPDFKAFKTERLYAHYFEKVGERADELCDNFKNNLDFLMKSPIKNAQVFIFPSESGNKALLEYAKEAYLKEQEASKHPINSMDKDAQLLYEAYKGFSENGITAKEAKALDNIDETLKDASIQVTNHNTAIISDITGKSTEVGGRE